MKPRALIIDHEVQIRRLLRVILEEQGYGVDEAETGQAGLTEATENAANRGELRFFERRPND